MRTLQEKYNGIQEGKFSKENFLADARRELPNLVTRFNGYDDAVQILKNRGMIQEVRVEEARLTKNNLTDYRYKPTNEMDKYPYEQILRGLRVELEAMGIPGTPTAEEYAKALAKVSKNLAKDSIFYTNQLAGVNPKVDQHDQMVDATAKNTVDTFNGMKKAELKESFKKLIKKVLSEEVIDVEDYNGEDEFDMYGDDEADDIPHPRGYEDQDEIDYDDENFSDPFIDGDLEEIATDITGFPKWRELDPEEKERIGKFVKDTGDRDQAEYEKARKERLAAQSARLGKYISGDVSEAEDKEADKDMVRKLMTMYETEPSKFEKLHKQAQTQASTSKDIKYKHLLSLIDRAKAGALQSLSNHDRAQADSEGMDEEFTMDKFKKGLKNFGRTAKQVGSALIGEPTYDHIDSKTGEWKKDRAGKDYDMYSYADKQGADLEPEEDLNEVRKAKSLSELLK
jgi:hypothetical protein